MSGETNIKTLLSTMSPLLNDGDYVFCTISNVAAINPEEMIALFKENEGWTIVLDKKLADKLGLAYSYISSWITLTIHSSLEAVGLTAAFSAALAKEGISCNVMAAYYHDHIFVAKGDAKKAMAALRNLTSSSLKP